MTYTHNDLYNIFGNECIQIDLVGEIYSGDKRIGGMFMHKRILGLMYVGCTTLGIVITWTEDMSFTRPFTRKGIKHG